eukprot:CAMPEP_0116125922 /NCGR_PEP_ID=MMETSP0329-20121206/6062_1 /TAXON_ID=697910 /ORGANISM="Pseudo-nitzschia arenysensis, Strain B593" /LENGTH=857 /DNA_ID=CAMNT_0003619981 /DNA_START=54 /DNA_END=2630 /DNA_ORIENTATION=+
MSMIGSINTDYTSFDEIEAMRRGMRSFSSDEGKIPVPTPSIEKSPVEEETPVEEASVKKISVEESFVVEAEVDSLKENITSMGASEKAAPVAVAKSTSHSAVEFSSSMASEVTQNRAHLSPKKTRSFLSQNKDSFVEESFPEEIASPASTGILSTVSDQSQTNHVSNVSTVVSPTHSVNKNNGYVPRILANHQRVPGGAAAKLFGNKQEEPEDDGFDFGNDGDDALEVKAPLEELMKSRDQAIAEFSVGSPENKRYHAPKKTNTPVAEETTHSRILDRDEVFHENATSAIVSILTPSNKVNSSVHEIDILSAKSTDIHMSPSNGSMKGPGASPFSRPSTDILTLKNVGSEAVDDAIETMTSTGKNPLVQHLLTKKTERHLAAIKVRMKDPTKNLTQLMDAIVSPENGLFDRHYMVRRKNACGALKVLTANASHRVNICWTVGILPALASVLEDSGSTTLVEKFPNANIRRDFFEARKRALSCLMSLAQPKNNKLPIFHCPKLVAGLVRVIEQDNAEARRSACNVLAQLSKSKENRLIMAQVPGLIDAVTTVIEPKDCFSPSIDASVFSDSVESENSDVDVYQQLSNEIETSISEKSPVQTMSEERIMSDDVAEMSSRYDNDPDPFLLGSRTNVFAMLSHLVKEKDNEYILARHAYLVSTLVGITKLQESSSQDIALKLLANMSRHRSNSKVLVFKFKDVIPALVYAMDSNNDTSRLHACYCLQNFSQDKPCRQQLASVDNLLPVVCRSARDAGNPEEKLAALHALKNLCDEPANLIPMSNTPDCFATLIQVAHASDESVTEMMQYVGCDALATLSHWFRSIATSGYHIGANQENTPSVIKKDELFVPSQRVLTWDAW